MSLPSFCQFLSLPTRDSKFELRIFLVTFKIFTDIPSLTYLSNSTNLLFAAAVRLRICVEIAGNDYTVTGGSRDYSLKLVF